MAQYKGMEDQIEFGDYFEFDNYIVITYIMVSRLSLSCVVRKPYLWDFQPGLAQTWLYSYRKCIEA